MAYLIIIVVLFLVLWVLMIRPQKRRQQTHQQMLSNVRAGDEIVTAGGLYGTVTGLGEDELEVEIAPGTVVRIARRAIAGVVQPEVGEEAEGELEEVDEPAEAEPTEPRRR